MNDIEKQKSKAEKLAALHHLDHPLILPNVWGPLGALIIEDIGFPAVATSSSALAMSHGFQDGENISFEEHLEELRKIASVVSVPVTADVEAGYASDNTELADHITAIIDSGIVGINFEDTDRKTGQLFPIPVQQKRLEVIRETAIKKGVPLFVNARIDTYVHAPRLSDEEKLRETIRRGKAYKEAGAGCLFPIIIGKENHIKSLVDTVGLPVNVLSFAGTPALDVLQKIGVARISIGGSMIKVAYEAVKEQAELLFRMEGKEELEKIVKEQGGYLQKLVDRGLSRI